MDVRPAVRDDAEAIERIRVRGWQVGYRHVFPPEETLADNPRTRRFYEAAGWRVDGLAGTFDRFGVSAPVVRYAKRL